MTHLATNQHALGDEARFRPHHDVLCGHQAGSAVLLSLTTQSYFSLNGSASAFWEAIERGASIDEAARELASQFKTPLDDIRRDLEEFVADLLARQLLQPLSLAARVANAIGSSTRPAHARTLTLTQPSITRCLAMLSLYLIKLRLFPVNALLIIDSRRLSPGSTLSTEFCAELTRRIRFAAALLPWRATCLPQSLAVIALLEQMGVESTLRIGIYPFPFAAHAWVECAGSPVTETTEALDRYRTLAPLELR